jgi:dihydroneopterin aldolase
MFDTEMLPVYEDDLAWEPTDFLDPGPDPDPEPSGFPADLDGWEPDLFLAAVLATTDRTRLTGYDLVTLLRARWRMISHLMAEAYADMAEIAHCHPDGDSVERLDFPDTEMVDEIRTALSLTRRAADAELGYALDFCRRLPDVWAALAAGEIDVRKAKVISDETITLDETIAREVAGQVLDKAPNWTTGQLRVRLRRLAAEADPDSVREQYEHGLEDRHVVVDANPDGTGNIAGWSLPADRVAEARDRIQQIARTLKTADEVRTMDQLRADVFLDLLCGTEHQEGNGSRKGVVDIRVDLETLAGLTDTPGEIPGYGPVIADIARQIATEHGTQWQITLTHHNQPIWVGTTRRRPTTEITRRVRARYPTCVFPGCRITAKDCHLDHNIPISEGGPTREDLLCPLCEYDHHHNRHNGWKPKRLPNGQYQWTSPLGHVYITEHPP